jgi:hypothetical protein
MGRPEIVFAGALALIILAADHVRAERLYVNVNDECRAGEPSFWLQLSSEYDRHTTGYSIDTSVSVRNDSILVHVGLIRMLGNVVGQAFCPATSRTQLEIGNGTYNLVLWRSDQRDSYLLTVTRDSICTVVVDTSFTIPGDRCVERNVSAKAQWRQ